MDTIAEEEEEKGVPLNWWFLGKTGGGEVSIPLGDGIDKDNRRHSLNLPRTTFSDTSKSQFSPTSTSSSAKSQFSPSLSPNVIEKMKQISPNSNDNPKGTSSGTQNPSSPGSRAFHSPGTPSSSSSPSPSNPQIPAIPNTLSFHRYLQGLINDNTTTTTTTNVTNTTDDKNSGGGTTESQRVSTETRKKGFTSSKAASEGDFTNVLPKEAFLREMAEREIIETETAYVRDLAICIEEFYMPMKVKELLPKQDMDDIFINIEAIANIHIELEKDLRAHANIPLTFQKMTPFLRMYSSYCANGTKALQTLIKHKKNPAVDKFLAQCLAKESVKGQPLESYLIKPTQRLCKYPLLLQSLLTNTESGTMEYTELEQVLEQIKAVVTVVNEKKRQVESLQKLEELKSQIVDDVETLLANTSIFLKEGQITVLGEVCDTLTFFLFDDLLLATKPKGKKHKKKLVHAFGLDRMLVKDVVKLDESVPKTAFDIWTFQNDKRVRFRLAAQAEREKKNWVTALEKATTAKAVQMHERFCKLSFETTKLGNSKPVMLKMGGSATFDTWFLQRKIRLFGEDIVLKYDQQIQQLREIRNTMQEDYENQTARHEQEDAETDTQKLKDILQRYNTEQVSQMTYLHQLELKLAKLEQLHPTTTTTSTPISYTP